jgi:hypothetical protein
LSSSSRSSCGMMQISRERAAIGTDGDHCIKIVSESGCK